MKQILFFSFFILMFSCKDKAALSNIDTKTTSEKIEPVILNKERSSLPNVPKALIEKMIKEVDYIDYIFYNLPISVSQDEKEGINSNILFISPEPAGDISSSCKPIGRKFYNAKGVTLASADIYFTEGCSFYVFLDGEKALYSSKLTKEGVNFYTQIINQGNSKSKVR